MTHQAFPGQDVRFCWVQRKRVLARLSQTAYGDVGVIAGGSGYGKTTVLAQLLCGLSEPGGMIAFPRGGDATDVARCFADALTPATASASPVLDAGSRAEHEPWFRLRWIGDRIRERGLRWIALDDAGFLDESARTFLAQIIEREKLVRWFVTTLRVSDLPLAQLVAAGRVVVVGPRELAFDAQDARALATGLSAPLEDAAACSLVAAVEGWPVAVALAIREGPITAGGRISGRARAAIADFVEQRIVPGLHAEARAALAWTPYVGALDRVTLSRLGFETAEAALTESCDLLPLLRRDGERFTLDEIVLDRLRTNEERRPRSERRQRWLAAGEIARERGRIEHALRAYSAAEDDAMLRSLLHQHADALIDRGFFDDVADALQRVRGAETVHVEAQIESLIGHADRAEALLRGAAQRTEPHAVAAAIRLSTLLLNRGRPDPQVLREAASAAPGDRDVVTAYAVALAGAESSPEAREWVARAAVLLRAEPDDAAVVAGWHRLGLAHHFLGDGGSARECCSRALEISERDGLPGASARIRSVLYSIAVAADEDEAMIREAEAMVVAARRAGLRQLEIAGLTALLLDAAERGDDEAFARWDAALGALGPIRGFGDAFAYALAHTIADVTANRVGAARERIERIVRRGEEPPAVVACASAIAALLQIFSEAGRSHEILAVLRRRRAVLTATPCEAATHVATLTHATEAFIEAAFGQTALAQRAARRAAAVATTARERVLANAAQAAARAPRARQRSALEQLSANGLTGYARLFLCALPQDARRDAVPALSALERELLRAYSARRTAKEIAHETGRNVETVRTHIRNISKKLGASGREELIAAARLLHLL